MNPFLYEKEPRAEELIAEIYRQYTTLLAAGKKPDRVYLPITYIRRLRIYRALLGGAVNEQAEYLEWNGIFGISFFLSTDQTIVVSDGPAVG